MKVLILNGPNINFIGIREKNLYGSTSYDELLNDIEKWAKELKGQGVKLYILSNTNDKEKIENIVKKIDIPYQHFAMKPLKRGFKKAQKELGEKSENIAIVGDQIFTDVIGGKRCNMYAILVEPIQEKDFWYTAWKRPIENKIKNKIKSKQLDRR